MALIVTLGQNITKAKSDDDRLRAVNNFLDLYRKMVEKAGTDQPIPYCKDQTAANGLVKEGRISPNSLFINESNGKTIGVARFVVPPKVKEFPVKAIG
jgi:hypothetical protein